MRNGLMIVAVGLLLTACSSTKVVTVDRVRTDTVKTVRNVRDSIYMHDSIRISEKGDTVTIESGLNVKERFIKDDDCYSEEGHEWTKRMKNTGKDTWTNFYRGLANRTINKVVDVPLIRTVLDVALRPIDGTTKIKSYTFVRMEAGKGSAEYPRTAVKDTAGELVAYDLAPSIKKVAEIVGSRVDALKAAFNTMCEDIVAFNNISKNDGVNPNEAVISVNDIVNAGMGDLTFKWDRIKLDNIKTAAELKKEYEEAKKKFEKPKKEDYKENDQIDKIKYQEAMNNWKQNMNVLTTNYSNKQRNRQSSVNEKKKLIKDSADKLHRSILDFMYDKEMFNTRIIYDGDLFYRDVFTNLLNDLPFQNIAITKETQKESVDWPKLRKHYMRAAVYNFLTNKDVIDKVCAGVKLKSSALTKTDLDGDNWTALVNDFVNEPAEGDGSKSVWAEKYKDPIKDPFVNRKRWRVGLQGKILLSDNSDNTLIFDRNGEVKSRENSLFTKKTPDKLKDLLKNIGA